MYKAVIFDLDGTLIDTIDDLADSMNNVLKGFGYPTHGVEAYKYFVGNGMKNLAMQVLPKEHCCEDNINKCYMGMVEEYTKHWAEKSKPYNEIPELLKKLEAKGLKLAVLSNKRHEFTRLIIKELLPGQRFEIVNGERDGVPRKPDPSGALEIANLLNISPDEILYLGDTSTDMITANAAGMYAVGVLWGFRKAEELLEHGAKTLISKPMELLKLLD